MAAACPAHATTETLSGSLTADNGFFAFISTNNSVLGTQIGTGANWQAPYQLTSTNLSPGTYYLQIEAINWGGPGAFIGDFSIGAQTFSTNTSSWSASYNNGNAGMTVQSWVKPTGGVISDGANGVGPWGTILGIGSGTIWIDAATNGLSSCQNCTVDFSTSFTVPGAVPELSTWAMMLAGFSVLAFAGYRRSRQGAVSVA